LSTKTSQTSLVNAVLRNMITQQEAFTLVADFRLKQDAKHGNIANRIHVPMEWAVITRRQVDLAIEAYAHGDPPMRGGTPDMRPNREIVLDRIAHAAACGVACLEQHGEDMLRTHRLSRTDDFQVKGGLMERRFMEEELRSTLKELNGVATEECLPALQKLKSTLIRLGVPV
jgi:hypothetical protein